MITTAAAPGLHLLVLARHDLDVHAARARAEHAWLDLRARGLRVTVQHEHYAFEVLASDDAAAAAMASRLFSSYCRGPVDARILGPEPAAQRVAAQWNVRFAAEYRHQYDRDPERPARTRSELRHFARTYPCKYGEILAALDITTVEKWTEGHEALHREATAAFRERTGKSLRDATAAAGQQTRSPVDPGGTRCTVTLAGRADPPKGCHGRIAIGVVLVQLTAGLRFRGPAQEHRVMREVIDGLAWLVSEHPDGNLTFVLRFEVPDPVTPSRLPRAEQFTDVLRRTKIELDGTQHSAALDITGIDPYRKALARKLRCEVGKAIVITPHASNDFAVGYTETHTWITYHDDWRGRGAATLDGIVAHELLHHFGAYDEYVNEHVPCACASAPLDRGTTPNGNCPRCTTSQQRCVMNGFERRLCAYTRAAIGWYDLFVELTTSTLSMAGTDDRLWLDLGDRVLPLDTWEHDDHEPSQRAGYCFWGVGRNEIKRILLRKEPGSLASAWLPEQVGVWYRGWKGRYNLESPSSPPRWLDDVTTCWAQYEGIIDHDYVTLLEVELVTRDHEGSCSMRLWLDDRSWVLPCSIPAAATALAVDQYSLDPGTGLRRSQLHRIRLERVHGHGGYGGPRAPSPTAVEALTIRSNRKLLLATGPLELDASQWVWPCLPAQ